MSKTSPFTEFCKNGDSEAVERHLRDLYGRDDLNGIYQTLFESADENSIPAFIWAVSEGHLRILKLFAHFAAQLDHQRFQRQQAAAASNDNNKSGSSFVAQLRTIRAPSSGSPALAIAAAEGHLKCVQFLIDVLKCDVNESCPLSYTAAHLGAERNQVDVLEFLARRDADLSKRNMNKYEPIDLARFKKKKEAEEFLMHWRKNPSAFGTAAAQQQLQQQQNYHYQSSNHSSPNSTSNTNTNHNNTNSNNVSFVDDESARVSLRTSSQQQYLGGLVRKTSSNSEALVSPMTSFAETPKHLNLLQRTVSVGGTPKPRTEVQKELCDAAYDGNLDKCYELLSPPYNADPNYRNPENGGSTAAFEASQEGHVNILQLLHRFGCDFNICDSESGSTCAHGAAYFGRASCLKFLASIMDEKGEGVKLDVENADGQTPLFWAESEGHADCVVIVENWKKQRDERREDYHQSLSNGDGHHHKFYLEEKQRREELEHEVSELKKQLASQSEEMSKQNEEMSQLRLAMGQMRNDMLKMLEMIRGNQQGVMALQISSPPGSPSKLTQTGSGGAAAGGGNHWKY